MQISVKLFASLSRFAPHQRAAVPFEVECPAGETLAELVERLGIPAEEAKVAFVNGIVQPPEYCLHPGDQVGIFPPIGGGCMANIRVEVWLYGSLARYGGDASQGSYANLFVEMREGSRIADLLERLQIPGKERGITFVNGELSALPDVQPDLDVVLKDGDRVAFFHLQSMWPFQYRFGAPATEEMQAELKISSTGKRAD